MSTVHLYMMKLKRDRQCGLQPAFAVFTPHHHGVTELIGILVDNDIQLRFNHGRGADDHVVVQEGAFTPTSHLLCQTPVFLGKLVQILAKGNVARIDGALHVLDNDIHGKPVVPVQLALPRQQAELADFACSFADAPAQQHVEAELVPLAVSQQLAYIQRLHQRDHRHG